jgi:hypothetical protein
VFATAEEFRAKVEMPRRQGGPQKTDEVYRSFDEALGALGGDWTYGDAAGIQRRHSAENFPWKNGTKSSTSTSTPFSFNASSQQNNAEKGLRKNNQHRVHASFFGGRPFRLLPQRRRRAADEELTNDWSDGNQRQRHCTRYMATEMNAALVPMKRETGRLRSASRRTGGNGG